MPEKEFNLTEPKAVRVRIAPSPTGFLHIGTARSALFNYLFAKKYQGDFILRIEDTDLERSSLEFEKDIIESLKWLGLEWAEGPIIGGPYGPYRQSERTDYYKKYLTKLLDEGKAYYCFCSEEELESQRQYQMSTGEAPRYSGKCAELGKETVDKLLAEGKSSVIRFKMPEKKVIFHDLIRGKIEFDSGLIGDIVIAKNLDTSLYNFAVVVDDYEMKISHVIRGEDHISNTPKHILLQEALGFDQPQYAHLPLILATDRTKLSKRHGSNAVSEYRKEGYLSESIINFLALLGWNPGNEREIYSLQSLVKEFSLEKVQKGGAVFDVKKLDYMNGFYIRHRPIEKVVEMCLPYLIDSGLIEKDTGKDNLAFLIKIISLYQDRLKKLSEISGMVDFFFKDRLEYDKSLLKWKELSDEEIKSSLEKSENLLLKINDKDWKKENLEKVLMEEAERMGDRGKLLWPLRVALTGKEASAGPFDVIEALGREKSLKRIMEAVSLF